MFWVISRYNHDISYLPEYTEDFVLYDRSEEPINDKRVIRVPNIGSDLYDKFTFIIDNYENLPAVAVYTKANIWKYTTKEEFDNVKNNQCFTPILTMNHRTYKDETGVDVCFYQDGIYWERNNRWYLGAHPPQYPTSPDEIMDVMGIQNMGYIPFAPGSNYILTKENILQHPKQTYEILRNYLSWTRYPGEAQVIERGLYTFFRP